MTRDELIKSLPREEAHRFLDIGRPDHRVQDFMDLVTSNKITIEIENKCGELYSKFCGGGFSVEMAHTVPMEDDQRLLKDFLLSASELYKLIKEKEYGINRFNP